MKNKKGKMKKQTEIKLTCFGKELSMLESNRILIIFLAVLIMGIILAVALFMMALEENQVRRNMKICALLNGTFYAYALDQPEFLCQIPNKGIMNLDNFEIVNITELIR